MKNPCDISGFGVDLQLHAKNGTDLGFDKLSKLSMMK